MRSSPAPPPLVCLRYSVPCLVEVLFLSEHALSGTRLLHERYGDFPFGRRYTYLFEVIYPADRVIVDYGEREDLVLVAVIETDIGISSQSIRRLAVSGSGRDTLRGHC